MMLHRVLASFLEKTGLTLPPTGGRPGVPAAGGPGGAGPRHRRRPLAGGVAPLVRR